MTERERLIELLMKKEGTWIRSANEAENIADYLLANNVIALPCKVGDTIYRCGGKVKKVYDWKIERIKLYFDEIVFVDDSDNEFTADDIGKTVFLTSEEAEKSKRRVKKK